MKLIPKYQNAGKLPVRGRTNTNYYDGIQTSEDIGNPVYSKKRPLSIKQQKQIFIKDRQIQGLKDFDKMARVAYRVARLIPGPVGLATDFIDTGNNLYNIFKNRNGILQQMHLGQ